MMNERHSIHILTLKLHNFINYTYIVIDEVTRQAVIVDPSWEFDKICVKVDNLNISLVAVLLTHSHYDHTNLAERVAKRYDTNVYMSHQEIEYYNFRCKKLNQLYDEDILRLGYTTIKCIYTPGHTAGSVCYLVDKALFVGDCIFIEGCGICSSRGASPEEMFKSIQKIKSLVTLDTKIFPAHSFGKPPGYSLGYLIENNIYFQIMDVNQFVNFRMRKGQTGIFNFR